MAGEETIRPKITLGGHFYLTDHFGTDVTDETFRGQFMLIFFGFTNCKVICPQNLAKLSRVMDLLATDAKLVKPIYVTVDPERDTPDVIRCFLETNFPRFLGLTGSGDEIERMKRLYKVYAAREATGHDGDYDVPHSAMTFLMGADGRYITHFVDVVPEQEMAQTILMHIR